MVKLLWVMLVLGLGFGWAWPNAINIDDAYNGQEVFTLEEQYITFKEEVIKAGSNWYRMDVMSSDPPILVKFGLEVEKGYEFPYGERSTQQRTTGLVLIAVFTPLLAFMPVILLSLPENTQ